MKKKLVWRVRVMRANEEWVDIEADDALQAETNAAILPRVISVFARSAIRGDKPLGQTLQAGIEDE